MRDSDSQTHGLSSPENGASAGDLLNQRLVAFSKYLSRTLLHNMAAGRTSLAADRRHFHAAVLFADVSGFTKLTERLTGQYGSDKAIGAEHLTFLLSDYFDHLIEVVLAHGGDVIKFAGDAILILFPEDDRSLALKRAATCGVKMQKVAQTISDRLRREEDVDLSLKVAISAGEIAGLVLGGILDRWEYAVLSRAIGEVGRLGDEAQPDDVMIGESDLALLGPVGIVETPRTSGMHSLSAVPEWDLQLTEDILNLAPPLEPMMRSFVPAAVASRISAGQTDTQLVGELRRVTILFINLPDFGWEMELQQTQKIITTIQEACYAQRGSIDKISCDDKGVSVIAGFGVPPMSAEDDPVRAVKAAMNMVSLLQNMGLRVSIGVASGPVYCGTLGNQYRQEYTLMGDGVNTAARLMTKAEGGVLCDSATRDACDDDIEFADGISFNLKGKSQQVTAFSPVSLRTLETTEFRQLVGRQQELATLVDALDDLYKDRRARTVVIEGEGGIGKSALTNAFWEVTQSKSTTTFYRASASAVQTSFYGVWRELLYQALNFNEFTRTADMETQIRELATDPAWGLQDDMLPVLNEVFGVQFPETALTQEMSNEIRASNTHAMIRNILMQKARDDLLVMEIDDAQWMDSASWKLFIELVRDLTNTLFLVLLQPITDNRPPALDQLDELVLTRHINLGPLSRSEISTLVSNSLEVKNIPDAILDLLMSRGEGHPLYCEVLANDMRDRGILIVENSACELAPNIANTAEIELPSSMESAIVSRMERLSLNQQLALKTASVIGRSFSMEQLAYLYPMENTRDELNLQMDALSDLGMTQPQIRHVEYLFKQGATQRIAYDMMLFSQRKKLHRQVAEWLEERGGDLTNFYPDLARHWTHAEEPEKAVHYLHLAAQEADRLFANFEVIQYLERIDTLTREHKIRLEPMIWAGQKRMLGAALQAVGQIEGALRAYSRALKALGFPLPEAEGALLFTAFGQIFRQIARRFISAYEPTTEQENIARYHLAADISERLFIVYYFLENMPGLIYSAFASTNRAEETGELSGTLAKTYTNLGNALGAIPLRKAADYYIRQSAKVAEQVDDINALIWYHLTNGLWQAQIGNWELHEYHSLKAGELALSVGDRRRWEETTSVYCIGGLSSGRFHSTDEEGHYYQQIYRSGFSRGVIQSQTWGFCMWTLSNIAQGHFDRAEIIAARLEKLMSDHPEEFDPVNVMEAATAFSQIALHNDNFDHAVYWVGYGSEVVANWGRPTTWRSIPCCYGYTESALRLWAKEKALHGSKVDERYEDWVKIGLKNLKSHHSMFDIARSKYHILCGWYELIKERPKKAQRSWIAAAKAAKAANIEFDNVLVNLFATNLPEQNRSGLLTMNRDEIEAYLKGKNVTNIPWHEDWRV